MRTYVIDTEPASASCQHCQRTYVVGPHTDRICGCCRAHRGYERGDCGTKRCPLGQRTETITIQRPVLVEIISPALIECGQRGIGFRTSMGYRVLFGDGTREKLFRAQHVKEIR